MLGERLSAEQAEQWGLIYRVVDDAALRDEALTLARQLATQPTYGLALIKRALNQSYDNRFDQQLELERDLQRLAGRSEDYREGVSAFMNKRTPRSRGADHGCTRPQHAGGGDRCRRHGRRDRPGRGPGRPPGSLYDNRPGAAAQAVAGIDRQLGRLVEKGKLPAAERAAISARLQPVETLDALADARLVIEAIVENLSIKQGLLHQLEALCGEDCILASNTSSLSITSLAAGLKRPSA
jgi:hypothetical protein